MQTILPLPNNQAVKLTTARYYTPNGRSIQAKGIAPDIVVEDAATDSRIFMREADLQHHLTGDGEKDKKAEAAKPAEKPAPAKPAPDAKAAPKPDATAAAGGAKAADGTKADGTKKEKEDVQLAAALKHLKGLPVTAAVAK